MKRWTGLQVLGHWVKDRKSGIMLWVICMATILCMNQVYKMTWFLILYEAVVCLFFTMIFAGVDFVGYQKKSRELVRCLENSTVTAELDKELEWNLQEEILTSIIENVQQTRITALADLQERERLLNDYYTMWIHQIKTPIAAMHLILQAEGTELPWNHRKAVIEQELFSIEQYAGMVLQFVRIRSASTDLVLQEYELYHLVKQTVKKYAGSFIRKKLSLQLQEFNYKIVTDEKWFCICIEQIISNGIKYTEKGGIRIDFEKSNKTLIIEDTGIGIQQEDIQRIFECGFTGHNGRIEQKSTGIGLYLCKQIAEKLGYEISVSSVVGKGTTFRVRLEQASVKDNRESLSTLQN